MYAVLHGGVDRELRQLSIDYLTQLPFDGFAIGSSTSAGPSLLVCAYRLCVVCGVRVSCRVACGARVVPHTQIGGSVGRNRGDLVSLVEWMSPKLPKDKPCHLLGIGSASGLWRSCAVHNNSFHFRVRLTGDLESIADCVAFGIDTFDSAYPTRYATRRTRRTQHTPHTQHTTHTN
jgi:queuine tRNA-ribosyltransferase